MNALEEMRAFVEYVASRDGQHIIYLDGKGAHADSCLPCKARALLAKIEGQA